MKLSFCFYRWYVLQNRDLHPNKRKCMLWPETDWHFNLKQMIGLRDGSIGIEWKYYTDNPIEKN